MTKSESPKNRPLSLRVKVQRTPPLPLCLCKVTRVEREGVQMLKFDGQNACDHFEPDLHPATKPSSSPPPRRGSPHCMPTRSIAAGVRFLVPSGDPVPSNINWEWKKHIPANHDITDFLPKLFEQSIVAVLVNEKFFFYYSDLKKKRKIIFKKAESKKKKKEKKRNSEEKRKIDIYEIVCLGEKGSKEKMESSQWRWLSSASGEKELWQEISKLLNVKESQLTLSHMGYNQEKLDMPKRTYSAESTSTQAWWNQTLQCSLSQHIPLHFRVTSWSQIRILQR